MSFCRETSGGIAKCQLFCHIILRGVFVNEKYYYHSFRHCDTFCRPKWRIWLVIICWKKLMKKEDATVIQYEQPIKIEKPLQCLCCSCTASFVKEITLPFSKVKSWLKKQKPIFEFSISLVRRQRYTKAREAYDVSNTCSSSIAGDKVHVRFVASSQMHTNQSIMSSC